MAVDINKSIARLDSDRKSFLSGPAGSMKSLVNWYYSTYLVQPGGLDINCLWLVTIWPQEGNEQMFLKMVATEAARYDLKIHATGTDGVPDNYGGCNMGQMVVESWKRNVRPMKDTNVIGWAANNVLMPVVDVQLPVDSIRTKTVDLGPGYTWVPPLLADKHDAFKPFIINFYYTTYPFSEFVVRPWSMAINRWGLKLAALRCNMVLSLFTRNNQYDGKNGRNWLHKYDYRFYGCYPLGVPNIKFDYKDSAQDKMVAIQFGYDFFRIDVPGPYLEKAPDIVDGNLDFSNLNIDREISKEEDDIGLGDSSTIKSNAKEVEKNDIVREADGKMFEEITRDKVEGDDFPYDVGYGNNINLGYSMSDNPARNEMDAVPEIKPKWLDTALFPISFDFSPDPNDEPSRVPSQNLKLGPDEPKPNVKDKEKIGGDDVNRVGERFVGVGEDDMDSLDENLISPDGMDNPDRNEIDAVPEINPPWFDTALFPISLVFPPDPNDEPFHVPSPNLTPGPDEPSPHAKDKGNISGDEVDRLGERFIGVGEDELNSLDENLLSPEGIDDIYSLEDNSMGTDPNDESEGMTGVEVDVDENDEMSGARLGYDMAVGEDEAKVVGRDISVGNDEPAIKIYPSESISDDEPKASGTDISVGNDEPAIKIYPSESISDDEPNAEFSGSLNPTDDEPNGVGSRSISPRGRDDISFRMRELNPGKDEFDGNLKKNVNVKNDDFDGVRSRVIEPRKADEFGRDTIGKDLGVRDDEPEDVPIILIENI